MFKINKNDISEYTNKSYHVSVRDIISGVQVTFVEGKCLVESYLDIIDFDNCLIHISGSNILDEERNGYVLLLSDDIVMISVEDKLKYSFPDDVYFWIESMDEARDYVSENVIYHTYRNIDIISGKNRYKLNDLSVDIQLYILNNMYFGNIFYMKD